MLQQNPDPVDRYWPTLGLGVGPHGSIDYPTVLPGMVPADPAPSAAGDDVASPAPSTRRPKGKETP